MDDDDDDFDSVGANIHYRDGAPVNYSAKLQGGIFEFKSPVRNKRLVGGCRRAISDFSPAARLRMLKTFHRINFADHFPPLFVTLTYPDELATPDLDERNLHRKTMARKLEKFTKQPIPAAWRVEWMPRLTGKIAGTIAPHWHWLIFRHRFIHRDEVNRLWRETIGWKGYLRTETVRVRKDSAIKTYMAKYISKEALSLSLVIAAYQRKLGRQYGWLRKSLIPMQSEHDVSKLSERQIAKLIALAEENLPTYCEDTDSSFTLMGELAKQAGAIILKPDH